MDLLRLRLLPLWELWRFFVTHWLPRLYFMRLFDFVILRGLYFQQPALWQLFSVPRLKKKRSIFICLKLTAVFTWGYLEGNHGNPISRLLYDVLCRRYYPRLSLSPSWGEEYHYWPRISRNLWYSPQNWLLRLGGFTALSTKGISSLLSLSLYHIFTFPIAYLLLFILTATAILQVKYLNKALARFSSTVPPLCLVSWFVASDTNPICHVHSLRSFRLLNPL